MFTVVVPVLNRHEETERFMESWFRLAKSSVDILFIDNGSDEPLSTQSFIKRWQKNNHVRVLRNEKNVGVYPTFQDGFKFTGSKFIFYSHNDVSMLEYGWDEKINRILSSLDNVGVAGMFGAKKIGTDDIYRTPYDFRQLMRGDCVTTASMADGHGSRPLTSESERIIVLDGYSLICSRKMIQHPKAMNGRFDHGSFPPHHMYDIDICVTSHYAGFRNFVIDVDCIHHGGATSTREKWAEKMGTTDLAVHRKAHEIFYEKWRNKLPITIKE